MKLLKIIDPIHKKVTTNKRGRKARKTKEKQVQLCSNFNSRELFRFFGHNSRPSGAFLTKIGGTYSSQPEPLYNLQDL